MPNVVCLNIDINYRYHIMSLPRTKEKPILLRIPENYISVLDYIVQGSKGKFRSRNDLVTEIIGIFLSDLKNAAEVTRKKK